MPLTQWIAWVRKALIAAAAGLGVVGAALLTGSDGGSAITGAEWVAIASAIAGALGVYAVPNGPRPPTNV